jgi:protein TonB
VAPYTAATAPSRDRLLLALLPAAALHVIIIFGITFDALTRTPPERQLEVTLLQAPAPAPEDTSHLARSDQRGSGDEALRDHTRRAAPALPTEQALREQRASSGGATGGARRRRAVTAALSPEAEPTDRGTSAGGTAAQRLEALRRRLAALEAAAEGNEESASTAPRTRRLTAVSARSAVEAAYLQAWRQRLEAIGNSYYPRASLRYGLYGELLLRAVLRSDGSLEGVELLESSGYAVLDQAALKIVRMAAPYDPFPPELAATADRLEIIRSWEFEPAGG